MDWRGNITTPAALPPFEISYRLYPSGGEYTSPSTGALVKQFNAVFRVAEVESSLERSQVEGGKGLFDHGCDSWTNTGFFSTGEFAIEVVDGKAVSVSMLDSNVTLTRIE